MIYCDTLIHVAAYGWAFTFLFAIFYSIISKHSLVELIRKTEKNLPSFSYIEMMKYMQMGVVPPWVNDKKLIERYRRVTIYVPLGLLAILVAWGFFGVVLVNYCEG